MSKPKVPQQQPVQLPKKTKAERELDRLAVRNTRLTIKRQRRELALLERQRQQAREDRRAARRENRAAVQAELFDRTRTLYRSNAGRSLFTGAVSTARPLI